MNLGAAYPGKPRLGGIWQLGSGADCSPEIGSPTSGSICAIMLCIVEEVRNGDAGRERRGALLPP